MSLLRPQEYRIRTPEGVTFAHTLASPLFRALAWSIDLVTIAMLMQVLYMGFGPLLSLNGDLAAGLLGLLGFLVSIGYAVLLEWYWRGQTLGKRLLGLRVQDADGLSLRFSQVLIRNLMRAVDTLPLLYLAGTMAVLWTRRAQRLGDLAGNTIVIRLPRWSLPDLTRLAPPIFNSLRDQPHLAARYRQLVSPREASLALQAVLRGEQLEDRARAEVFRELARYFREMIALPPDQPAGVTDEHFIRDLVDVLYRKERIHATMP